MNPQEVEFHCLGIKIAGQAWGDPGAPTILALHGWLDNAASFQPLAAYLAEKYRLVAIDLWGHGQSGHRPQGVGYPILDYVALIESVRRQLGEEPLRLMGHSLGAAIAALYAGSHPEHCESLILIEGIGPLADAPEGLPARVARHVRQTLETAPKRVPVYSSYQGAAAVRERATGLSTPAAQLLARRGTRVVEGGVTWSTDAALKLDSQYRLTEAQVCSFLAAVKIPVCLITAAHGFKFADGEALRRRLEALQGLTQAELPGGHHVHMDDPAAVANVISRFLLK